MINCGKLMLEAVCPICDNIYLMDYFEGKIDDEDEKRPRAIFHCEDCDRYVRAFKWKTIKCGYEWLEEHGYYERRGK